MDEVEDAGIGQFVLQDLGHSRFATARTSTDSNDIRLLHLLVAKRLIIGERTVESLSFGFD